MESKPNMIMKKPSVSLFGIFVAAVVVYTLAIFFLVPNFLGYLVTGRTNVEDATRQGKKLEEISQAIMARFRRVR